MIKAIHEEHPDFICLNFANGDMVGHTGVYEAIKKAIVTVDECVGQVVDAAREASYDVLVIADHGNADHAVNDDGSPSTGPIHSIRSPVSSSPGDYRRIPGKDAGRCSPYPVAHYGN